MSSQLKTVLGLLALQLVAIILYPPAFFEQAQQALVLPPALFLLLAVAVISMNTGFFTPEAGRVLLNFVQGVNIVVRMVMLFPNLQTSSGSWDWSLLITTLVAIGLSWYAMTQMDKRHPATLLLSPASAE